MARAEGGLQVEGEVLLPLEAHGVKLMSMGFINPGAMPLRGAKVTPIVQQLLGRTAWGVLDFLIVDSTPQPRAAPPHRTAPRGPTAPHRTLPLRDCSIAPCPRDHSRSKARRLRHNESRDALRAWLWPPRRCSALCAA
eukprot:5664447-Prymnesium_polylepis.1